MSSANDDHAVDAAGRIDELCTTIRNGLAPGASTEAKTNGVHACRVALRVLEPMPNQGPPASSPMAALAGMFAGTPIGEALKGLGTMPREQVVRYVMSGARSLFSQNAPMYRQKPPPTSTGPGDQT